MQLHPNDSARAVQHSTRSLSLGYVGLDFSDPLGDLTEIDPTSIPFDFGEFANSMAVDDLVLVVAHHYPHALARVIGEYNCIRRPVTELEVWFRHFRPVEVLGYYADHETNPANWVQTTMTDTISKLNNPDGISYKLIEKWVGALNT